MYLQLGLEQARKEARGVVVNIPLDFYQYLLNNEHEYLTGKTFNGGAKSKQKGDATTSGISQG